MGYNTDFSGRVKVVPPVDLFLATKINELATDYRADLPEGAPTYGGLQWVLDEDGAEIRWDYGEKFYDAPQWMKWLIDTYLAPAGHVCNGEIEARGEDYDDHWFLIVRDNSVFTQQAKVQPCGPLEPV